MGCDGCRPIPLSSPPQNGDDRETGSARANKPQLALIMDSIESMYIQ